MDTDGCGTPQKKMSIPLSNLLPQVTLGAIVSPNRTGRKTLHPRSPSAKQIASAGCTSYVNQVVNTPPAKRFHRVRNPFEAALAERLHLPLIASPSLFQCPTTPQFSSTQFEWTIDDVSSLKPAHVEPHETQFQDSPDPDYEAKAQMAISSYFKEQQIVPSPVDCPLRSHRIILSEMNGNTPISKPGRRIRECGTQTELSLPAVLPEALEDALRPYLRTHSAECNDNESTTLDRKQIPSNNISNNTSGDFKDTSLRRKLFDMHNIIILDSEKRMSVRAGEMYHSNPSPVFGGANQNTAIIGKLSDSTDKSSFGSLSPISASDRLSISPHSPFGAKRKSRLNNFLDFCETETLSPIHPPLRNVFCSRKSLKHGVDMESSKEQYRSAANASEHTFSDLMTCEENKNDELASDRSSSPLQCFENAGRYTDSSFNIKVSRLVVNTSKSRSVESGERANSPQKSICDVDIFLQEDTNDIVYIEDGDLQTSRLSAHSSICSSSNSDTPRGKRRSRSASRKNLSQSFSTNWFENDADEENVPKEELPLVQFPRLSKSYSAETFAQDESNMLSTDAGAKSVNLEKRLFIQRTDSGFNEMTSSQNTQNDDGIVGTSKQVDTDISMGCCSTPSKQNVEIL